MKNPLAVFALFVLISGCEKDDPHKSGWVQQESGISSSLNSVFFVDSDMGYTVGDEGIILKTINGGTTWTKQTSGTTSK